MLTEDQIRKLLAVAMGYDNRRPGELNVAAWREASRRGRWTFDAALEALHEHCTNNPGFVQPGHITQRLAADRRQPATYDRLQIEGASPATPDGIRAALEAVANAMSWPPVTHDPELDIACPYENCRAPAGRPCVRRARRDEVRPITGYHRSRTEAASNP